MRAAIAVLVGVLTACAGTPKVSDPSDPEPPRVDCRERAGQPVPPWPVLGFLMSPVYAIELLGLIEQDRTLRHLEHQCIDRLKAEGVIR